MPEIPILIKPGDTRSPAQLVDSRDARLYGDALSAFGEGMRDLGATMLRVQKDQQDKEMDYRVALAREKTQSALNEARLDKRFSDPKNDPSGVESKKQMDAYAAEIQEKMIDEYGLTGSYGTKYLAESQNVINDISLGYAIDIVKDTGDRIKAVRQQLVNERSALVMSSPNRVSEEFARIDIEFEKSNDYTPDQKAVLALQEKRQIIDSAINGRMYIGGADGMGLGNYNAARKLILSPEALQTYSPEERVKMLSELDAKFHRDTRFRADREVEFERQRASALKESQQAKTLLLREDRIRAENNAGKIANFIDKVSLAEMSGSITPEQANGLRSFKVGQLALMDDKAGVNFQAMLISPTNARKMMSVIGLKDQGDQLRNAETYVKYELGRGNISDPKGEEMLQQIAKLRQFARDRGRSFEDSVRLEYIKANIGSISAGITDPKVKAEVDAQAKGYLLNQVASGSKPDMDNIRGRIARERGTGLQESPYAGMTAGQIALEVRKEVAIVQSKTSTQAQKEAAKIRAVKAKKAYDNAINAPPGEMNEPTRPARPTRRTTD